MANDSLPPEFAAVLLPQSAPQTAPQAASSAPADTSNLPPEFAAVLGAKHVQMSAPNGQSHRVPRNMQGYYQKLGFLPTVGGAVGSFMGGGQGPASAAGAALLGGAGEAIRQLGATTADLFTGQDIQGDLGLQSQSGLGQAGELLARQGIQGGEQGIANVAGQGLAKGAGWLGGKFLSGLAQPSAALVKRYPNLLRQIESVPAGRAGVKALAQRGAAAADQLNAHIAQLDAQGATHVVGQFPKPGAGGGGPSPFWSGLMGIPNKPAVSAITARVVKPAAEITHLAQSSDILQPAAEYAQRMAQHPTAGRNLAQYRNLLKRFVAEHPGELSSSQVQALKQRAQDQLDALYTKFARERGKGAYVQWTRMLEQNPRLAFMDTIARGGKASLERAGNAMGVDIRGTNDLIRSTKGAAEALARPSLTRKIAVHLIGRGAGAAGGGFIGGHEAGLPGAVVGAVGGASLGQLAAPSLIDAASVGLGAANPWIIRAIAQSTPALVNSQTGLAP